MSDRLVIVGAGGHGREALMVAREINRLRDRWFEIVFVDDALDDLAAVNPDTLDRLDLPFDSACLAFHEQTGLANTASYAQVRRPIYTDSIGRYRHYESQLQGVREALSDLIDTNR